MLLRRLLIIRWVWNFGTSFYKLNYHYHEPLIFIFLTPVSIQCFHLASQLTATLPNFKYINVCDGTQKQERSLFVSPLKYYLMIVAQIVLSSVLCLSHNKPQLILVIDSYFFVCPGWRQRKRLWWSCVSTVCLWGVCPRSQVSAPARWSCAVKGWLSSARPSCRASTSVFLTSTHSCKMGTCVSRGTGRAEPKCWKEIFLAL